MSKLPAHSLFLYLLIIVYGVFVIVYCVQNEYSCLQSKRNSFELIIFCT